MLNLFPVHKLLFLQFHLGYLHLCNLLFWFRNNLLFFCKDLLNVAERARVWVNPSMCSLNSGPRLGSFVHLGVFNIQRLYI